MRQATTRVVGCLALLLVALVGTSGRADAAATECPPGGLVSAGSAGLAAAIAATGYNNKTCALIIDVDLSPPNAMTANLTIIAKSVQIGPPASGSGSHVDVVNNSLSSSVRITAVDGNLILDNAIVKAHKLLNFKCSSPGVVEDCTFTSTDSEIVAALNFDDLGSGGVLIIDVEGNVHITTTKIHGGDEYKVLSDRGNITIGPCGGSTGGICEDPLTSGVSGQLCPGGFPCDVTFQTADDLHAVCFPSTPGEPCNGGFKEKRFEAKNGFIDVRGTAISAHDHMTFWCGPGGFLGQNSILSTQVAELVIDCTRGSLPGGDIHLEGASLTANNLISLKTDGLIFCENTFFSRTPVTDPFTATCVGP